MKHWPSGYAPARHRSQKSAVFAGAHALPLGHADPPGPAAAVGKRGADRKVEGLRPQVRRLVQHAAVPSVAFQPPRPVEAHHVQLRAEDRADGQRRAGDVGRKLAAGDPVVGDQVQEVLPGDPLGLVAGRSAVEVARIVPGLALRQGQHQPPLGDLRFSRSPSGRHAHEPRRATPEPVLHLVRPEYCPTIDPRNSRLHCPSALSPPPFALLARLSSLLPGLIANRWLRITPGHRWHDAVKHFLQLLVDGHTALLVSD